MRFLAVLLLIAFAGPAWAVAKEAPQPPSFGRSQAKVGDLTVLQLATDSVDRLFAEWAQPTPPRLTTTTITERDKPIFVFVTVGGCKRDDHGNCDVVANFDVIDPSGGSYARQGDAIVIKGPAPGPKDNLMLSQSSLGIVVENGEQLGVYLVKVEVTDRNAKVSAHTEQALTVVEAGKLPRD